MLPEQSLPVPMPREWRELLGELAPVFARRSTFRLFTALACGMILADRSTVVAMAAAAGVRVRPDVSVRVRPGVPVVTGGFPLVS